jgi:chromosome segregation ATPase
MFGTEKEQQRQTEQQTIQKLFDKIGSLEKENSRLNQSVAQSTIREQDLKFRLHNFEKDIQMKIELLTAIEFSKKDLASKCQQVEQALEESRITFERERREFLSKIEHLQNQQQLIRRDFDQEKTKLQNETEQRISTLLMNMSKKSEMDNMLRLQEVSTAIESEHRIKTNRLIEDCNQMKVYYKELEMRLRLSHSEERMELEQLRLNYRELSAQYYQLDQRFQESRLFSIR